MDWMLGADFAWRNPTLGAAQIDTGLHTGLDTAEAALGGAASDIVDPTDVFSPAAAF